MCQIADALIALQQVGNVKYIGWTLEFPCAMNFVNELQEIAKTMNGELEEWKQTVEDARNKFYELNYFTMVQLLDLRRELGKLKDTPSFHKSPKIEPSVLSLLHSVSPQVDNISVMRKVQLCIKEAEVMVLEQKSLGVEAGEDTEEEEKEASSTLFNASGDQTHTSQLTLTYEKLNETQKAIYNNILGFNDRLVLMALSTCGEDENECMKWCYENDKNFPDDEPLSQQLTLTDDDTESLSSGDEESESVVSDHSTSFNGEYRHTVLACVKCICI